MKYEEISKYSDKKFIRKVGISRDLFELLSEVVNAAYIEKHKKGGRKPKLTPEDILLLTLTYYRDYPTFFALSSIFKLNEANIYRWTRWCEGIIILVTDCIIKEITDKPKFDLNKEYVVDVTECTIQRPKVNEIQKEYYSGKKKKHTIKMQIIIEQKTKKIIYVAFDKGSVHDFNLFKKTCDIIPKDTSILADNGYQGIKSIFENSLTPKKKSKNNPLSTTDKEFNNLISSIRISVEHTNCQVKIFRVLSEKFRSRIKNFKTCALIICGLYNING